MPCKEMILAHCQRTIVKVTRAWIAADTGVYERSSGGMNNGPGDKDSKIHKLSEGQKETHQSPKVMFLDQAYRSTLRWIWGKLTYIFNGLHRGSLMSILQ